jgi:outer membrane autotransporter protein
MENDGLKQAGGASAMRILMRNLSRGAAALLGIFAVSAAHAQCGPSGSVGISSATGLLATLNTVNTAFLTQTNAFVAAQPSAPDQLGGGVWGRAIGGQVTLNGSGTVTFLNPPAAPAPCTTKFEQRYAGFQLGGDIAKLNVDGTDFHFGATGGYINATGNEVGGPATGSFEVPFVGAYAAVIRGGFFADVMVRYDQYRFNGTQNQVGLNAQTNGHTYAASGSAGYHYSLGSWFIEPSAGITWARFSIDPIPFLGNAAFNVPAGNLLVNDIDSLLGRAGVRFGVTQTSGNMNYQPFVAVSVWHEFADNSLLRAVTNAGPTIFNLSTDRVGTYGQYAVGISASTLDSRFAAYARVDYRKGDNIEAWGLNAGIRYQFGVAPPSLVTKG